MSTREAHWVYFQFWSLIKTTKSTKQPREMQKCSQELLSWPKATNQPKNLNAKFKMEKDLWTLMKWWGHVYTSLFSQYTLWMSLWIWIYPYRIDKASDLCLPIAEPRSPRRFAGLIWLECLCQLPSIQLMFVQCELQHEQEWRTLFIEAIWKQLLWGRWEITAVTSHRELLFVCIHVVGQGISLNLFWAQAVAQRE